MPIISILSSSFCNGEEISKSVAEKLSYKYIGDDLFDLTSEKYEVSKDNIYTALFGSTSIYGMSNSERRKIISYIQLLISQIISKDNIVCNSPAELLLPKEISHILRVCIVADFKFRTSLVSSQKGVSEKEANAVIKKDDKQLFTWSNFITNLNPWDRRLYDIIIPMHKMTESDAVELIVSYAKKEILQSSEKSRKLMTDFVLASQVNSVLTAKKHDVVVKADRGHITVLLGKYTLRLEHYKQELSKITMGIEGVKSVEVNIGPKFKMPSTYPPVDFEIPKKILLVDDEVEFVQTLSERLETRKMPASIAYNGEEALLTIEKDEPEVMVLDLKMPGIGGLDVLKKVKSEHPDTEVIILTGHGSEKEKDIAMELGAFAYLEKPIDITVLSETMKQAYAKLNLKKSQGA
ncbi:response regulator [Bacteroidota bacterium]